MTDTSTRPGEMSEREMQKLAKVLLGGQIKTHDPRVTNVFNWFTTIFSSVGIILLSWMGNSMLGMREDIAVIKAQKVGDAAQLTRVETQVSNINIQVAAMDRRLTAIEAKAK